MSPLRQPPISGISGFFFCCLDTISALRVLTYMSTSRSDMDTMHSGYTSQSLPRTRKIPPLTAVVHIKAGIDAGLSTITGSSSAGRRNQICSSRIHFRILLKQGKHIEANSKRGQIQIQGDPILNIGKPNANKGGGCESTPCPLK